MAGNQHDHEIFSRTRLSLWAGICAGVFSLAVDLDHLLCIIQMGIPALPIKGWYGCKIWHGYIGPAGWIVGGVAIAWMAGFILYLGFHSTQPATCDPEVRQDDDN